MSKLIYTVMLASVILSACNTGKKQEKAMQKQVLDLHEKAMADEEKAMMGKMKLDTLIEQAKLAKADTTVLNALRVKLDDADDAMGNWMANFTPDYTGKGHEDVMRYFTDQQTKVLLVDSLLLNASKQASAYLESMNKK